MGGMGRLDQTPLYDVIEKYNPEIRLHMPGTSGYDKLSPLYAGARFDVTELDFSDNLLSANGVIRQSEILTAQRYRSEYCLYFTSGTTTALLTAILTAKGLADKFYCLDVPHKSITNAFELFGVDYEIVDVLPDCAKGIIITSPDYYGVVKPISEIRKRFPEAIIIVDEAHGAHFAYSSLLPDPTRGEADLVVNSLHKTLPVFTGGAILRTDRKDLYEKGLYYRAKVHTTSPSYMTMCSMDFAGGYMWANGERLYRELKQKVDNLRLPDGFTKAPSDDFSRLVIVPPEGVSGYDVSKDAQEKGIYFELVESERLVAILTPFNADKLDILSRLSANPQKRIEKDLSVYIGTIAKNDIGLYPPGKVYVKKGEIITQEIIELLQKESERVFGLE